MKFKRSTISAMALAVVLVTVSCGFSRPRVNNSDWSKPRFDHANFSTECSPCHEETRPSPVYKTPHGNALDCASCHRYTSEKTWTSHLQYSHVPSPKSCLFCHGSLRPAPPHTQSGDCVSCHKFPSWSSQDQ